jgi:hypothetical protein
MNIPGTNLQGFTIKELPPVADPETELPGALHEVETLTGPDGAPQNKGLTTEQWIEFLSTRLGGGPGGPVQEYTSTETLGGINAGDVFTTDDPTLVQLLVKYQTPGFAAFSIDGQGSRTLLVGTSIGAGFKSVAWTTSNAGNVAAASIGLRDLTANTTLLTNEPNDGVASASTAAFLVVLGESRRYRLTGKNSLGADFSADIAINGLFESFFGYSSSNGALSMAAILNLGGNVLQSGKARTVGGVTAAPGQYTVYAWPSNGQDDIAQVLQDGVDSIRGAFGPVRYVTGPNSLGATVTMGYIISNATKAFTNSSLSFS